jgi:hypothetical protein
MNITELEQELVRVQTENTTVRGLSHDVQLLEIQAKYFRARLHEQSIMIRKLLAINTVILAVIITASILSAF